MLPSQNNEQAPLCYIDQKKVNKYNYYTFFCVLFMTFAPRELYMNMHAHWSSKFFAIVQEV